MLTGLPKSKSERKREAEAVEKLVQEILQLPPTHISQLPCSEELRQEIVEAQKITEHGGRRRQIKYIAKQLRAVDHTAMVMYLDATKGLQLQEAQEFRSLERLRNWICQDETGEAAQEAARMFPSLGIDELQDLAEQYRKTVNHRYLRDIFRRLKAASDKTKREGAG